MQEKNYNQKISNFIDNLINHSFLENFEKLNLEKLNLEKLNLEDLNKTNKINKIFPKENDEISEFFRNLIPFFNNFVKNEDLEDLLSEIFIKNIKNQEKLQTYKLIKDAIIECFYKKKVINEGDKAKKESIINNDEIIKKIDTIQSYFYRIYILKMFKIIKVTFRDELLYLFISIIDTGIVVEETFFIYLKKNRIIDEELIIEELPAILEVNISKKDPQKDDLTFLFSLKELPRENSLLVKKDLDLLSKDKDKRKEIKPNRLEIDRFYQEKTNNKLNFKEKEFKLLLSKNFFIDENVFKKQIVSFLDDIILFENGSLLITIFKFFLNQEISSRVKIFFLMKKFVFIKFNN